MTTKNNAAKVPKPRKPGWRFLREGEKLRHGDRFQWTHPKYDGDPCKYGSSACRKEDLGKKIDGPVGNAFTEGFSGYIRRIPTAKKSRK